ncbi:NAD(P)/FAD-dependent oxidoreductase [Actinoallomurus sp. NPDC052308]|uniref:flavin-containing monooxygenase n=1 Tax=Actinoallomurus sp. NPDC052308 TaxID=3155530 RepID=UPI00343F2CB3
MKIAIIGSGFGGLGMAIQLKRAGFHDFVVLEKSDDLGGTWRDNQYPGCACDVPSHMYSFSFELNPDWSRMFAPQPEIWDYLRHCVDKYDLGPHLRFGCAVETMEWEETARHWRVTLASGEVLTPKAVVSAIGALHVPSIPDIPGAERFRGTAFHSAQWDPSADLSGKRVAVIGTGASAIQFIPRVAEEAGRLHVFQRTPPWIQPKPDFTLSKRVRRVFRHVPGAQRAFRNGIYWVLETRAVGFTLDPRLMGPMEQLARRHIERQIDDPELRAKVTPDYTIGCKRILLSSDYYPALTRPHVDLVTEPIKEITETGLVTADGTAYDVDVIIYGTGFKVTEALSEQHIVGRDGLKIQEAWAGGIEAHHGVTVAGFPNLFLLLGPNTGLGHNSVVFMIESQVQHVLSCLRLLSRENAEAIEARPEAQRRFNDRLQKRLRRAVWNEGGCTSWYLDEHGVNRTLWPGFTFEYWARTRRARREDYDLTPAGAGKPVRA